MGKRKTQSNPTTLALAEELQSAMAELSKDDAQQSQKLVRKCEHLKRRVHNRLKADKTVVVIDTIDDVNKLVSSLRGLAHHDEPSKTSSAAPSPKNGKPSSRETTTRRSGAAPSIRRNQATKV